MVMDNSESEREREKETGWLAWLAGSAASTTWATLSS